MASRHRRQDIDAQLIRAVDLAAARSSGFMKSRLMEVGIMGSEVVHFEVTGKDGEALQRFYSEVFGWKLDTNNPGGYGMVRDGQKITGGIGAAQQGSPGGVTFCVQTSDAKATLDKVEKLGGRVLMPPTEVAPETTIALFADPEGHVIGLM
jgi:predicted enzyme related to lactoylglutathione lyase